jgi:RNA polymerase sigma-70 factor, ECF subfamily
MLPIRKLTACCKIEHDALLRSERFDSSLATNLNRHMDGLYSYAMILTQNHDVAQNLVIEAYHRASKIKMPLEDRENGKSWLFTTLRTVWSSESRQIPFTRDRPLLDCDEPWRMPAVKTNSAKIIQVNDNEHEWINSLINDLALELREVIVLREHEGFSYREISSVISCKVETVILRLTCARSLLRSLID